MYVYGVNAYVMETSEVHCPKCGSTQLAANKKGSFDRPAAHTAPVGETAQSTIIDRHKKAIITCRRCGFKFRAGDGPIGGKAKHSVKEEEKKVASFMTKMFWFAIAGIVAVFIFLWAIGKFG